MCSQEDPEEGWRVVERRPEQRRKKGVGEPGGSEEGGGGRKGRGKVRVDEKKGAQLEKFSSGSRE